MFLVWRDMLILPSALIWDALLTVLPTHSLHGDKALGVRLG